MKKGLIEVVIGLVLVALLATGIMAVRAFRAPLAEPLSLVLQASTTPEASTPLATITPEASAPQATAEPANAPAANGQVCGLSGTMNILVIGRDEYHWEEPFGADAIRLVKLDFDNRKVSVFAFQRDLLLDTPSLKADFDVETYKLGEAYVLVRDNEAVQDDKADTKATNAIAQILYDNFAVKPDHYMTIEENVVGDITNTLEGVEVDVAEKVELPGVTLLPGNQVLDGETAMLYARYLRNGLASEDEWGRLERQAAIFSGLRDKLFSVQVLPKIPQLFEDIKKSLVTDLSPQQITDLTCFGNELTSENVESLTIAREDLNILADETMIIKDERVEDIDKSVQALFGTE